MTKSFIENRPEIWKSYKGIKRNNLERTFLAYDRYSESELILEELKRKNFDISSLIVMDYGCAVGDYGITFARNGATAMFYDIDQAAIDFVKYRFQIENLKWYDYEEKYNFLILGEILEHLDDPKSLIQQCIDNGVKLIFTSSYPYRSNDPEDSYWKIPAHSKKALLQQPACRELLEENFEAVTFDGAKKLWFAKPA